MSIEALKKGDYLKVVTEGHDSLHCFHKGDVVRVINVGTHLVNTRNLKTDKEQLLSHEDFVVTKGPSRSSIREPQKKKTQMEIILLHLMKHGYITRATANVYNIGDLRKPISVLRSRGFLIDNKTEVDDLGRKYTKYQYQGRKSIAA